MAGVCGGCVNNTNGSCNGAGGSNEVGCSGPTHTAVASHSATSSQAASPAAPRRSGAPLIPAPTVQVAGSSSFLDDSTVRSDLSKELGAPLQDTSLGSRDICKVPGLIDKFAISDSGSDAAATCVEQQVTAAGLAFQKVSPYESPMVIITHASIVPLLEKIGLVTSAHGLTIFNIKEYLSVFASGEKWVDIPGNTSYQSVSRILLWTTGPQHANSGGMLAAIAYAAQNSNDDPVIAPLHPGDPRVPVIRSLYTELGGLPTHTQDLLRQFLTGGIPMAMVYEVDYLNAVLSHVLPAQSDVTVMYPNPDVLAQETFVSWKPEGYALANLLMHDPTMQADEEQHGCRTAKDASDFVRYMKTKGIIVPSLTVLMRSLQFARLPTESGLEALINAVTAG
jgi:hypothetical protein